MPTPATLEELKTQWREDPCWNLEDTPGFETHREELRAYQKIKIFWEPVWAAQLESRLFRLENKE